MTHKHFVSADLHFTINSKTRNIARDDAKKTVLVQYDHNSVRAGFKLARYIDGHDMSLCRAHVHYINMDGVNTTEGVYEADDLQISLDDSNFVAFSWLISGDATKYVGALSFVVCLECMDGDVVSYRWQTAAYTDAAICDGIYNVDFVEEEFADVIAKWYEELSALVTDEAIRAQVDAYFAENPVESVVFEVDGTVTADGKNAVSGAAVAAYVTERIAAITNYTEVAF